MAASRFTITLREAMRKADHRNPLRSHEHFDALCARAGLAVRERRYYNVVFKAVVEDLGLRLLEQARRGKGKGAPADSAHGHGDAPGGGHEAKAAFAPRPGRLALLGGHALTWLLNAPVSNSGRLAALIRATDPAWSAEVVPDPDAVLVRPGAAVATADAGILDRCGEWVSLARALVKAGAPGAFVVELGLTP